jgi:hypothetical protein
MNYTRNDAVTATFVVSSLSQHRINHYTLTNTTRFKYEIARSCDSDHWYNIRADYQNSAALACVLSPSKLCGFILIHTDLKSFASPIPPPRNKLK